MASGLSAKHFHDEVEAYAYVEARLWPEGPVCPHCGGVDRIGKMGGKSTRIGTYKCYQCRKPFTVKVGTVFQSSHVKMNVWLQAMYLIAGSKKGMSSNQLHRILGVTLKTAWFMSHRIREAMRSEDLSPFGKDGTVVEADETYLWRRDDALTGKRARGGWNHKMKVLSLVDRETGNARSFTAGQLTSDFVHPILRNNIAREARLFTDEAKMYRKVGREFSDHKSVTHGRHEYVRGEVHTNTIEGYFSIFKRGMRGVYQHCREKHLHRYLAEFDFRYSNRAANGFNDNERADELLNGIVGKRLTYERVGAKN